MARLIYSAITSLDGYVEDGSGAFDWAMPDEEVHVFVNDLERSIGTHLYGRRMYETMTYWETAHEEAVPSDFVRDFTDLWRAAEKVVYSKTLTSVGPNARVARAFDPEEVRRLKARSEGDLAVGGATLASQALAAGLVDELQVFVAPTVVGGGKPWLPSGVQLELELTGARHFDSGFVFASYAVGRP